MLSLSYWETVVYFHKFWMIFIFNDLITFANVLLYLDSLHSYNLSMAVVYDIFTKTFQVCHNAIEESLTMPQWHRNYPDWPDHGKTQPDLHHMHISTFQASNRLTIPLLVLSTWRIYKHFRLYAFSDRAPNIKQDCIRCHSILFTPRGMWLVCGC